MELYTSPDTSPTKTKCLLIIYISPITSYLVVKKNQQVYQRQKTQIEETEQKSKPDMAGMVELSEWEFKATIINMLRALMYNIESMQKQMDNISKKLETLIKNQNNYWDKMHYNIKNKWLDELLCRLHMAEEVL